VLPAGSYYTTIDFWGTYEIIFCETMDLRIEIRPLSEIPPFCTSASTNSQLPDFSDMNSRLQTSTSYSFAPTTSFKAAFNNSFSQRDIVSADFTVPQTLVLRASVWSDFALGPMDIALVGTDNSRTPARVETYTATTIGSRRFLDMTIQPGIQYKLKVRTGIVQSNLIASDLTGIPSCFLYNLRINVFSDLASRACNGQTILMSSFTLPGLLLTNDEVHLSNTYFFPSASGSSTTIVPRITSYLRVFSDSPSNIAMKLYSGAPTGNPLVSASNYQSEHSLIYELTGGQPYTLTIVPAPSDPTCSSMNIQLALDRKPANLSAPCSAPAAIPSNLIPTLTDAYFQANPQGFSLGNPAGQYYYNQGAVPLHIDIPFTVESSLVSLRAQVQDSFLWEDLTLILYDSSNNVQQWPLMMYNGRNIPPIYLTPGSYLLEVAETGSMFGFAYGCISFSLGIWIEAAKVTGDENYACTPRDLATTFNTPQFLFPSTGQKLHFEHDVLINTVTRRDCVQFQVPSGQGDYLARFLTPKHYTVDVDLAIYSGGDCTNRGTLLQRSDNYEEEALFLQLTAGQTYTFWTTFYQLSGRPFPAAEDCSWFQLEVAIEPISFASVGSLSTCTDITPPSTAAFGSSFSGTYKRSLTSWKSWAPKVQFTVPQFNIAGQTGVVLVDLWYQATAGAVFFEITGSASQPPLSEGVPVTLVNNIGVNHAYLAAYLPSGTYTLTLADASNYADNSVNRPGALKCATYSMSFQTYNTTAPAGDCNQLFRLPTDLRASSSSPYGGPQASDGGVVIAGKNFYLNPTPQQAHNYMLFSVPQKSFVRTWYQFGAATANHDIDIALYNEVNSTYPSKCCAPQLLLLNPKATPYMLDVFFASVDQSIECATFQFEMAVQTESSLIADVACPATISQTERLPPNTISLETGSTVSYSNQAVGPLYFLPSDYSSSLRKFQSVTSLNVQSNSTLLILLNYNFLAYDFALRLVDSSGATVATGYNTPSSGSTMSNFASAIYMRISPGAYKLYIEDNLRTNINNGAYCHYFDMFLLAFADGTQRTPTATASPTYQSRLNPNKNLTLTIRLSQQLGITGSDRTNFLAWLNGKQSVALSTQRTPTFEIPPIYAYLDLLQTTITVTFSSTAFTAGGSYRLFLNTSSWKTAGGTAFARYSSYTLYSMFQCGDCQNNGVCDYNLQACACPVPWSGKTCTSCLTGYHGSAGQCVPNTYCTDNTCSGHGNCTDLVGYPTCTCLAGYVDEGTGYCNGCQIGYVMQDDGTCATSNDPFDEGFLCDSQLIPASLDGSAYLSSGNTMHLEGEFYVDPRGTSTWTNFTLTEASVMRLYVEPHWVDIDFYLWMSTGTSMKMISYNIAFNSEETLFRQLDPGFYRVQFMYYFWDKSRSKTCETFNMEWAITSVSHAQISANMLQPLCTSLNPAVPQPGPAIVRSDFSISSRSLVLPAVQRAAKAPYVFWNYTFTVNAVANKQPVLTAILGYRFLLGDLSLVLVEGNGVPTDCNPLVGDYTVCQQGSNMYNSDQLRTVVLPGQYSLYLYEPTPPLLANCSIYDFDLSITYEDPSDDIFLCTARRLPATFNAPGYFTGNFMHIRDSFLVDESNTVAFNLTQTSWMRIHIASTRRLGMKVYNVITGTYLPTYFATSETESLWSVPAGSYQLIITGIADVSCPSFNVELTIDPNPISVPCLSVSSPVLPSTITLPYNKTLGKVPVTYAALVGDSQPGATIWTWTFHIDSSALLDTSVQSDFLQSALKVSVKSIATGAVISGSYEYNSHRLVTELDAGDYILSISRPNTDTNPSVQCDLFNFAIFLDVLNAIDACRATGDALPPSFNTPRWIGFDDVLDYVGAIRVPQKTTYGWSTQQKTYFTPRVDSLLRVYAAPYKGVDVDIFLWEELNPPRVRNSGISFYGEENIAYQVLAGHNYSVAITYWGQTKVACPVYTLAVAMMPMPTPVACPGQVTKWPSLPLSDLSKLPVSFSGANYYFDQSATGSSASNTWTFTAVEPISFYLELDFDFNIGPLVILLNDTQTGTLTYSLTGLDRTYLNALSLLPGIYTLKIYAPVSNSFTQSLGCSAFAVTMLVDKRVDTSSNLPVPLPTNLNVVSYLGPASYPSPFVHFGTTYSLQNQAVTFTLLMDTFVRIRAKPDRSFVQVAEDQIDLMINGPVTLSKTGPTEVVGLLTAGVYTFSYSVPPGTDPLYNLYLEFELQWMMVLSNTVASLPKQCTTSDPLAIALQNGYYFLSEDRQIDSNLYQRSLTAQPSPLLPAIVFENAKFTLDRPTIVYAELGYEFLTSELNIRFLNSQDNSFITGKKYVNLAVIYSSLPAGNWSLIIEQDTPFPQAQAVTLSICRYLSFLICSTYSLTLIMRDADGGEDHANCASHELTPAVLNDDTLYGGPMSSGGQLTLYGDDFLALSDTMSSALTLKQSSLLSVYLSPASYDIQVTVQISSYSSPTTYITPLRTTSVNWNSAYMSTWSLPQRHLPYELLHHLLLRHPVPRVCHASARSSTTALPVSTQL
jgi:hypothetical protein